MKLQLLLWIFLLEIHISLNKETQRHCYQNENSRSLQDNYKRRFRRGTAFFNKALSVSRQNGLCSRWGNFHFKTFDGKIYRFPGQCNYLFASDCGSHFEDFNIQIQQSVVNHLPTITQISVKIQGLVFELIDHHPTLDGERLDLPFSQRGIQIEKSNNNLKISSKLMLILTWYSDDSVHLTLAKKYMGKICGLCADYDGDPNTEFVHKGKMLQPLDFGNLQKLRKPEQTCEDPKPEIRGKCLIYRMMCIKLLRNSKWSRCNRMVKAEPYIDAYMQDMCLCISSTKLSSFCLCNTLTEYARQCALAGGTPPDWRNPALCGNISCPDNLVFKECSSPCPSTCSNPGRQFLCDETCIAGCTCPNGLLLDDITHNGCVPPTNCSCVYNNQVYSPGESYNSSCYTCLCMNGHWNCEDIPCESICSVEGGSHITTFDKAHFTFHGTCIYVLAKSCLDNAFLVTIEMQKCSYIETSTCITRVVLFLKRREAIFEIRYDNSEFPHVSYDKNKMSKAGVTICWPSSFFMIVHTNIGLSLQVQLIPIMQLYVILDSSYKNKTCGLCGNFNAIQKDDFRASSGAVEGTVAEFANSWKTQFSCKNNKPPPEHPCMFGLEIEKYAHHWCNMLVDNNGPFAPCHTSLSPDIYMQNCLFDTCSCRRAEDCMCAALSSYVFACATVGILLPGWREHVCQTYKNFCPPSFVYSYTVVSCIPTCHSLAEPDKAYNFTFVPVDGCVCPKDTYLNDKGLCVKKEDCPCYYKDVSIPPNSELLAGRLKCICIKGRLDCNEVFTECHPPLVYFDCANAGPDAKGSECPQSCNSPKAQCYSPLCVSGCICPKGLYLSDNKTCIPVEECPCQHNGISYQPGQIITLHCDQCVCRNRTWVCNSKPTMGICTLYGEGHYITFDSKRYTTNGECEYILVQDYCDFHDLTNGTFRIITENIPCGSTGTTCSKAIIVFLGAHKLILSDRHLELLERSNGVEIPYKVRNMGNFLVIETTYGLIIEWDKMTTIFIHLSLNFKGKVCGLCGNFDGNSNNDFTTRTQCVVEDVVEFRDSWKLSPTCPEVLAPKDPCAMNPYRIAWAQKLCSVIISDVFSACHSEVAPDKYYEDCVSDTCACDMGGDCDCYCTVVAAYAQACSEACVCIEWRSPTICPIFCDYYNKEEQCNWRYKACGGPCMKTCRNPSGSCEHELKGLEGCYPNCTEEKPYFDEDDMQCVDQCGCLDNEDNYYDLGEKIQSCNNCESCVCTTKGITCEFNLTECNCEFQDQLLYLNETIRIENGKGSCIIVKCEVNGTVESPCYPQAQITTVPASTVCRYKVCKWSDWYDVSKPTFTKNGGDYETFVNIKAAGQTICKGISYVECRASRFPTISIDLLKQNVTCNSKVGLVCKNEDQANKTFKFCYNYEIRTFCCKYLPCPTGEHLPPYGELFPMQSISKPPDAPKIPAIITAIGKSRAPSTHFIAYSKTSTSPLETIKSPAALTTMVSKKTVMLTEPFKISMASEKTLKAPITPGGPSKPSTTLAGFSAKETIQPYQFPNTTLKPIPFHIPEDIVPQSRISSEIKSYTISPATYSTDCFNITCIDNKELQVTAVICSKVEAITCESGREPIKIYDQNGCCYYYECQTCVGLDGKHRQPGETWTQNCQECYCDKDLIRVSCKPLICPDLDKSICNQPWLEPFQILNEDDHCCPRIECRCVPAKCPDILRGCPLGYEAFPIIKEADCCVTFKCRPKNVCVFEGNIYKVGNSIWTDKSSCRECHCSNESNPITGLNVIKCISLICMTNCPQGYTYQKSPSACCGECVQVSCIVKDPSGSLYLLKPGESQSFKEDNCTQYSCKLINNNFVTSSQTQSCPKIREEECESVDIIKAPDGCCDICKVPKKTCMVQKKMTRITYKDCYADVTLSYCEGLCPSSTVFSTTTMNMLTTCGCCQELTAIKKIINLFCPLTNKSIQISVIVAVSCGCTSKVCKA